MFILNESDIIFAMERTQRAWGTTQPNVDKAVGILYRLMAWTNQNSDGWAYWQKPAAAAKTLQLQIHYRLFGTASARIERDITDEQLKSALTPVKSFLTRMVKAGKMTAEKKNEILGV